MKTRTLLFSAALVACASQVLAQSPASFNYQAVVRNASGTALTSQTVGYEFNIRESSPNGTIVYSESHSTTSDGLGLVNLIIGEGTSTGDISTLNWGSNEFYLNVQIDENGGTNYTDLGTSQLVSVPYAMHAETASNVDDADADPSNELQTLSINGSDLSISNGNTVTLPGSSGNTDSQAKAWVHVPVTGNPNLTFDGFGVTNVTHPSAGVYVISFAPGTFATATNPAMVATLANDLAPGFAIPTHSAAPSQVTVRTYNASGTLTNKEFSLIVFGKE